MLLNAELVFWALRFIPTGPHVFPETGRPQRERLSRVLSHSTLGKIIYGTKAIDHLDTFGPRDSHAASRVGLPRNACGGTPAEGVVVIIGPRPPIPEL
jgi:hypothetical protein